MKVTTIYSILFVLLITLSSHKQVNKINYVPDKETAIKIAELLWLPVYGKEIYNSTPFIAELKDNRIWVVRGTVKKGLGGFPYIEIQRSDCKVLKLTHTK